MLYHKSYEPYKYKECTVSSYDFGTHDVAMKFSERFYGKLHTHILTAY